MQLTYFSVWPQAASSMDSNAPVVGADRETTAPKQPMTNRHGRFTATSLRAEGIYTVAPRGVRSECSTERPLLFSKLALTRTWQ